MKFLALIFLACNLALALPKTYTTKNYKTKFATGLIKPPKGHKARPTSYEYLFADGPFKKSFHLKEVTELAPIKNQGQCGSCVYASSTAGFEDELRLRNLGKDILAPQFVMDCAQRKYMCNGSLFEYVAQGIVSKGGIALESDYPYKGRNQSCQGSPKVHGKIVGYKIIDNSARSIIASVNALHPTMVTIGAGGSLMNFHQGVFNSCQNIGTNHEVVVEGYDCETSVDAQGNCKFDSSGNLPHGVGVWHIRNSWGSWGDQGWLHIKMTDSQGRKCNNVTEEAGILDSGVDPVPPGPTQFMMYSPSMQLKVTLSPSATKTSDQVKGILQTFIDSLEAQ